MPKDSPSTPRRMSSFLGRFQRSKNSRRTLETSAETESTEISVSSNEITAPKQENSPATPRTDRETQKDQGEEPSSSLVYRKIWGVRRKGKKSTKRKRKDQRKSRKSRSNKKKNKKASHRKGTIKARFSETKEIKRLVVFALWKTDLMDILDNAGGRPVLSELDLKSIVREALRYHRETRLSRQRFSSHDDLPLEFLVSVVCVLVSHLSQYRQMKRLQDEEPSDETSEPLATVIRFWTLVESLYDFENGCLCAVDNSDRVQAGSSPITTTSGEMKRPGKHNNVFDDPHRVESDVQEKEGTNLVRTVSLDRGESTPNRELFDERTEMSSGESISVVSDSEDEISVAESFGSTTQVHFGHEQEHPSSIGCGDPALHLPSPPAWLGGLWSKQHVESIPTNDDPPSNASVTDKEPAPTRVERHQVQRTRDNTDEPNSNSEQLEMSLCVTVEDGSSWFEPPDTPHTNEFLHEEEWNPFGVQKGHQEVFDDSERGTPSDVSSKSPSCDKPPEADVSALSWEFLEKSTDVENRIGDGADQSQVVSDAEMVMIFGDDFAKSTVPASDDEQTKAVSVKSLWEAFADWTLGGHHRQ